MHIEHVFITGASGCVGHYLIHECLKKPHLHIHVLVRHPERLKVSAEDMKRISIHQGDFRDIHEFKDVIKTMDYVIHGVTEWWGKEQTYQVNVEKTQQFFMMTDPEKLKQIIYFSTASIIGKRKGETNRIIDEAAEYGSDYIKSKHRAYYEIKKLPIANKISVVFPTMVFGGDAIFPQSHITKGIFQAFNYLKYIRFIHVDGAFHFLHAADIASTCIYLMLNPQEERDFVLGNKEVHVKDAIRILYTAFDLKPWFRIHVTHKFIYFLAWIFRIKIGPWERYCIDNSYMVFDTVSPKTYGLRTKFETLESVISDIQAFNQP